MGINKQKITRLRELQQEDVEDMSLIIDAVKKGSSPDAACVVAVGYSAFALTSGVADAIVTAAADPKPRQKPEKKPKLNNQWVILHKNGVLEPVSRTVIANRRKAGRIPEGAIVFDSILEAEYYRDELLPKLGRSIKEIQLQPKYVLTEAMEKFGVKHRAMTYSADFLVTYMDGRQVLIDTKGHEDERFKVKRKVFDAKYPEVELLVLKHVAKFGGWITAEEYAKKKAAEEKGLKALGRRKPLPKPRSRAARKLKG